MINCRNIACLFVMVLTLNCSSQLGRAGDLEEVLGDVQNGTAKPRSEKGGSRKKERQHSDCESDDDNALGHFLVDLLGPPIFTALTLPWWGPHYAIGDSWDGTADFPQYPYESDHPGYLILVSPLTENFNSWGLRAAVDYGNDFSNMQRIGTQVLLEHSSRFGIDAEANHWIEDLGTTQRDAWSGDANLVFRFAQSEHVSMRSGIGVNWFEIDGRGDAGINFTYGADVFPVKPWVLKGVFDAGRVGDAGLFHARGTIGVQLHRLELFTGYDYLRIGDTSLHGMLTGIALWF